MALEDSEDKPKGTLISDVLLPITSLRKLRVLEAVGYAAALLAGAAAIIDVEGFERLQPAGLIFAIIVIVRLLVFNASLSVGARYGGSVPEAPHEFMPREGQEEETAL